jgi:hypothetical protein
LVRALLPWLAARPLERGLFAWDVLGGSLLVDDALLEELRAAARPLGDILPDPGRPGIDLNQHPSADLIARFGGAAEHQRASEVELLAAAYDHRLAALAELGRRRDALVDDPAVLASVLAFARALHLAHLPTLASVYFDYLARVVGYRPAGLDLCETLLDAEAPERVPSDAIQRSDLSPGALQDTAEYLVYRTWIAVGDAEKAGILFDENLAKRDRALGPPGVRLEVARAHVGLYARQRLVPLDRLDAICGELPLWRYAARVRVGSAAAQLPPTSAKPLHLLSHYIGGFGNDFRCWTEALLAAPERATWRAESCRILGREARHLPHEPAVWKPLLMIVGGAPRTIESAIAELEARLNQQSQLN